jgi:hypothetical protein
MQADIFVASSILSGHCYYDIYPNTICTILLIFLYEEVDVHDIQGSDLGSTK